METYNLTFDFLYDEHINKHKTIFQIGRENNLNFNVVEKYLKQLNIPIWKRYDNTNEYIDNEDGTTTVKVYNKCGKYIDSFVIDTDKTNYVQKYKWILVRDNIVKNRPKYRVTSGIHPSIILARYLLNIKDENTYVDHKDNDPLNNTMSNLRVSTKSQNQMNHELQSNNTSGYAGVTWDANRNKWSSRIKYKKKTIYLGRYDKKCDAIYARYCAEKSIFKDFRNYKNDKNILNAINECTQKDIIEQHVNDCIERIS